MYNLNIWNYEIISLLFLNKEVDYVEIKYLNSSERIKLILDEMKNNNETIFSR
jgi:hypothetical protein